MNTENKENHQLKGIENRPSLMNRRKFMRLMASVAGTAALSSIPTPVEAIKWSQTEPALDVQAAAAVQEKEAALIDLDTDFISGISENSRFFHPSSKPDQEAGVAELEATLDEPLSKTLSKTEGVEIDKNGKEIPYTEYTIEYKEQVFTTLVKTVDSQDYPTLHAFFNVGTDTAAYINKPITVITYNSDAEPSGGLDKITVYCLQSYDVNDPNIATFALNPAFYQDATDSQGNPIRQLKEEFTTLQFASAYNPLSINRTSEACGLIDFNNRRVAHNERPMYNSTVIISKKIQGNYNALSLFHFEKDFPTDNGAVYDPNISDTEAEMQYLSGVHVHELGHAVDMVYRNGRAEIGMYSGSPRDWIGESRADMSRAEFWRLTGDPQLTYFNYAKGLSDTFLINTWGDYEGTYNFRSYTPMLFHLMIEPYKEFLAQAVSEPLEATDSDGMITNEGLGQITVSYLKVRNEMIETLGAEWYLDWLYNKYPNSNGVANSLKRTFHTVYEPVIYARLKTQGSDVTQDKAAFMDEVTNEFESKLFAQRAELLEQLAVGDPQLKLPYFQEQFERSWKNAILYYFNYIDNPTPQLNETLMINRRVDPAYLKENVETSFDYYFRNYYPYYFLSMVNIAPEGQEFVISSVADDQQFTLVSIEPNFAPNDITIIEDGKRTTLKQNQPLIINPDKPAIIFVVDKRTNQVEDDLNKQETPLFTITAQQRTTPTPTPNPTQTPVPTETQTPPVTPTPTPIPTETQTPPVTPTPILPQTPTPSSELNLPQIKH